MASKRARPDDEKTLNGGSQYRRGCCSAMVCCTVCLACCCILLAAAFSAWWRLHSLSLEPLDIELVEGHMGCDEGALVDESFAPFGASRYISSRGNDRHAAAIFRERVKDGIYEVIRVQIVNGTLFLSCRRRAGAAAAAVADASWCTAEGMMAGGGMDAMMVHAVRTLDLLLSIARVPDVDFFIDVREHACHFHPRHGDALPVLTAETNVHKGCHNLLMPPRAFLSLPDGARWLSRAASDAREWRWSQRLSKAVWRGGANGAVSPTDKSGRPQTARAKAVAASLARPDLLSAVFAGRGSSGGAPKNLRGLGPNAANASEYLTWHDAQRYKAALCLDGFTSPDRLPFQMFTMTAVLKQESPLREGWYSYLVPYKHYIPLRHDLSDLVPQLEYAFSNLTRLHEIAKSGAELAMRHLSRRAQLCHWLALLRRLAARTRLPVIPAAHARAHTPIRPARWPPTIHEPFMPKPYNPLKPHVTHTPLRLMDDARKLLTDVHLTPCVGLSHAHLCVDL